ncbi:MAG TPA: ATP-binding protein [Jatrophihabitantaceae bacterium]
MSLDRAVGPGDVPRPAPRFRLAPRSLTARLVSGVVALVAVLVLATGVGTYFALRSFLIDRLDQQLHTAVGQDPRFVAASAGSPGSHPRSPQQLWLVLLDHAGNEAYKPSPDSDVKVLQLSTGQRARVAADVVARRDRIATIRTLGDDRLRIDARATSFQGVPVIFVVGLSTDEIDRTMSRLLELELVIGSSAVLLALAATASGVRFSLRRLRRVTRTAHEVAAELSPDGAGLDRRVPVTESGTEVGQLAESMNTLLAAVETQFAARLANEQRMRQFLADASHELRTPLTSIRGYAELARMQRQQGDSEPADNLGRIESEGTRMSRLVDDLLTLARSDQGGHPQRELVDIAELLDEAVTGARAAYPGRRIDSAAPPNLSVFGDRDQLLRVVRNLVTNAAVHTRTDGPIAVDALRDGAEVLVRVTDAGPGLPPDEAAHVFERFWRADKARSRVRGGTGLGLAIVASAVSAHGGTVRFDSTVEGGSTVTVRLPLRTG